MMEFSHRLLSSTKNQLLCKFLKAASLLSCRYSKQLKNTSLSLRELATVRSLNGTRFIKLLLRLLLPLPLSRNFDQLTTGTKSRALDTQVWNFSCVTPCFWVKVSVLFMVKSNCVDVWVLVVLFLATNSAQSRERYKVLHRAKVVPCIEYREAEMRLDEVALEYDAKSSRMTLLPTIINARHDHMCKSFWDAIKCSERKV